jgi:UrcA family protein
MNTLVTLASATFLSLAVLNVSHASDDNSPKSRTVQFADLDLSKPEGAATLFGRIKGAAKAVCSAHSKGKTPADMQRYAACIEFAVSTAVARVDEPVLTDYAVNRTGSGRKAPTKVASNR